MSNNIDFVVSVNYLLNIRPLIAFLFFVVLTAYGLVLTIT